MLNSKLLALLLLASPLVAASIEGTVTNSVTGAPVPRARVTVHGETRYQTTSAADGRFSIAGVAAGNYTAWAERVGFSSPMSFRSRVQLTLKADDSKSGLEIKLAPTGAIAGRVIDSDGEPVQGASVSALGPYTNENATTDEKGQFRIGGLTPAKYRVKASSPGDMMGGRPEIRTDGTAEVHNASSYYPGVLIEKEAGLVQVHSGGESAGVDIKLVRVPFVRVSGKVSGLPQGAENLSVMIWQGDSGTGRPLKKDGTFELWRLDPGKYYLSADWQTPNGEQAQTAPIEIEVAGSNIGNLELRFVPPSNISGRLEFEDEKVKEAIQKLLPGQLIQLNATGDQPMNGPNPGVVSANGADSVFRLEKVSAGKYRVSLPTDQAYVKSMRLGSVSIDGAVLDLSNGSNGADLTLTVSATMGSISGSVQDESGKPVEAMVNLLIDGGDFGFQRQVPSKRDGSYTINNLPPGTYKLVAIEIGDNEEPYLDAAETVELGPGAKLTKDLKRQTPSGQ